MKSANKNMTTGATKVGAPIASGTKETERDALMKNK
jgi:hypothetical protein